MISFLICLHNQVDRVYYHSKEALISEVVNDAVERGICGFAAAVSGDGDDPVAAAGRYFSGLSGENADLWRVILDSVCQSMWAPAFRGSAKEFFARLSENEKRLFAVIVNTPSAELSDFKAHSRDMLEKLCRWISESTDIEE